MRYEILTVCLPKSAYETHKKAILIKDGTRTKYLIAINYMSEVLLKRIDALYN